MRAVKRLLACLVLLSLASAAKADTSEAPSAAPWLLWGAGYYRPSYPLTIARSMDTNATVTGVSKLGLSADLFGFYWPFWKKQLLTGVILNIGIDRYSVDSSWTALIEGTLGASALWFFGGTPGSGLFARADLGPAMAWAGNSAADSTISQPGLGGLLGGGYAWALPYRGFNAPHISVLLNAQFSFRLIDAESYPAILVNASVLF